MKELFATITLPDNKLLEIYGFISAEELKRFRRICESGKVQDLPTGIYGEARFEVVQKAMR